MEKFKLGKCVITPGAQELLDGVALTALLSRHQSGDWGVICPQDKRENELSLKEGFRLMSEYEAPDDPTQKIWVITEHDRSVTTVLLPSEY